MSICHILHYQIWQDETTVTMMPSVTWTVPNDVFINAVHDSLKRIQSILDS